MNREPFIFDCEVFAYDWLFVFKSARRQEVLNKRSYSI